MYLTDTHTHLHFDQYIEDLAEVIQRAHKARVLKILTLGTDLNSSQASIKIANKFESVYAAIGIHPTDVHKSTEEDFSILKNLAREQKKVVAIGEIGLDLHWKDVPLPTFCIRKNVRYC